MKRKMFVPALLLVLVCVEELFCLYALSSLKSQPFTLCWR